MTVGQMPPDASRMMAEALRQSMPGMKTQAQFTAFMIAFDSFRLLCDALFNDNAERAAEAKATLEKSLGAIKTATELGKKFEEIPEENRGTGANPFTNPPNEFHEYDIQKRLLRELGQITTMPALQTWYTETKADRDRVVSQTLRNVLMDTIREKRNALEQRNGDPT